jgi:formate dehydrogenase
VSTYRHPGAARRRTKPHPKGRQVDADVRREITVLLGERSRARHLLIEYLHEIQDLHGCLPAAHLAALAEEMRLSQAEVYEVASFYAHFDIVADGGTRPPALTVRICDSLTCEMFGARELLRALPARLGKTVRVLSAPCMGRCAKAPVAALGQAHLEKATLERIAGAIKQGGTSVVTPAYIDLASYREKGGYRLLEACLRGERTPAEITAILGDAGLRGLGGAGFPAGRKWRLVRAEPGPRLMAVNADEGEPGTFKDRHYLESDPHRVLEGMLIAAWAVEAGAVYFYLRDEYPHIRALLLVEIAALRKAGLSKHAEIHLRRGAGAYICGEESAMIESIEGKRGLPRHRPPYVAQVGIFGRPTLVNNVETLFWVRDIVERGADWFAGHGVNGGKGLRSYSVSGRVREPGVKLAPAGITVRALIEEHCGGMARGHQFAFYLPGGASGGILPASLGDVPLDFGSLEEHGALVGSHAVIVLSERDDARAAALNLLRFFADESCGQCTPCRVGCEKAVTLMQADDWDEPLLVELCRAMADASICGLGQAAPNPIRSVLKFFPAEAK